MKKIKNLPLIIAIVLIVLAGVGFYTALQSVRNYVTVYAANGNLAAYSYATKDSFKEVQVTQSVVDSNKEILTVDDYEAKFGDGGVYVIYPFLADQFIVESGVASSDSTTFGAVLPSERVVAATTTLTGAALGAIRNGDVVNITDSGAGDEVSNAKVMCITIVPAACSNVLPGGTALAPASSGSSSSSSSSSASSGGVYVMLAVPETKAADIAGSEVSLVLNPFCKINEEGYLEDAGKGGKCQDDGSGRLATSRTSAASSAAGASTTTTPNTTNPVAGG